MSEQGVDEEWWPSGRGLEEVGEEVGKREQGMPLLA